MEVAANVSDDRIGVGILGAVCGMVEGIIYANNLQISNHKP